MLERRQRNSASGTTGLVLHSAARYDLIAWLFLLGRERAFREKLVALARLRPGETVLDVGCGTGTLAIAAKRRVGARGAVYGIDASPEMIARATSKARKAGLDVAFKNAMVEALPFSDGSFDVVLSTLMLHHLPSKAREACALEVRRVLKPGGRALVVDFGVKQSKMTRIISHFHRHGYVELGNMIQLVETAGLNVEASGALGLKELQFVLATAPVVTQGR